MLPLDLSQPSVGYRLRQAPDHALAVVDGVELPLDRLSPEDACALAARSRRFFIGDEVKVHFLGRGLSTPLVRASVARVHEPEEDGPWRLDFGFRGTDVATARKIASFVETLRREGAVRAASTRAFSRELVSDRDRIVHVGEILARNKTRALARMPGARPALLLRLIACDRNVGTLTWDTGDALIEESLQAELIGHSSIFMLDRLPVLASAPGRAITPVPTRLLRTRRRAVGRVRANGELTVRFRHPIWTEVVAARTVRDFSFRGVSFWCDAVEDLVYPGLLMDEVEVSGEGLSRPVRFRADVRMVAASHLTAEPHGGGHAVGMSLSPCSRGDRQRWSRLVGDRLYPATRAHGDGGEPLWEVYQRSGYFALSGKEPRVFAQRQREFQEAGKKLAKAPELGCRVLWSSPRGVECTVSVNKVYRHSWLGHQMARRPAEGTRQGGAEFPPPPGPPASPQSAKEALRETFLRAFETAHADPDIRWFVGYIEGRVRWMRAANIEFAQQHLAEDQAVALPFHLREGIPNLNAPVGAGAEVSGPMDGDQNLVLGALTQIRSRAYREAFDLTPSRFDMAEISRRWARAGMIRSRALRVARRNGAPVAAAILERGEPGINLFHLLNGVRLVVLPAGEVLLPEEREAALASLLWDASRWYAEAGVGGFVYLQELEIGTHADVAGLRNLGMGYVWALSSRLLPEWMEHVYELTSPRAPEPD
ncbi:MAG TPA: hypothetical protein VIG99_17315 [Myxococcaceae bacterium]|jgi:hypothetical protein